MLAALFSVPTEQTHTLYYGGITRFFAFLRFFVGISWLKGSLWPVRGWNRQGINPTEQLATKWLCDANCCIGRWTPAAWTAVNFQFDFPFCSKLAERTEVGRCVNS